MQWTLNFDNIKDSGREALGRVMGQNTIGNSKQFWWVFGTFVVLMLIYPIFSSEYLISQQSQLLLYVFLALSVGVIWGYGGIFSFAQGAFFGISGYTYAIVAINLDGVGTLIGAVLGITIVAFISFLLGYFMFYGGVSFVYVAIITLAVTLILQSFMVGIGSSLAFGEVTLGGFSGISGIPALSIPVGETDLILEDASLYYGLCLLIIMTYLLLRVILNSKYGYTMIGIREREDRTELLGYNVKFAKTIVFTGGGVLAAIGGILYASWGGFINPEVFSLTFATLPVIWVAVGGRKTLLGAIIGAYVIQSLNQQLSESIGGSTATILLGLLLVIFVLFLPEGVIPQLHKRFVSYKKEKTSNE